MATNNSFLDKKCSRVFWFDFNGTVDERFPLSYQVLKLCKQEILKIDNLNLTNSTNLNINSIGSKVNPIKLTLTLEQKYPTKDSSTNTSSFKMFNKNKSFIFNIYNCVYLYLNNKIEPLIDWLDLKFGVTSSKLDIRHYCVINGKLYITYKDSFMLFTSIENYLKDLSRINDVKLNYLYKKNILDTYSNIKLFVFIDTLFVKMLLKLHMLYLKTINTNRLKYRLNQTNWGFYINTNNSKTSNIISGLKFVWLGLRFWIVGLLLGLSSIYYLMYVRLLPFNKILFAWILVAMFLYWLLSGFVFFVKKYQYGRFTSVIQRFWKRSYIIFWLIEGTVFLIFLYLTLNSSSEPVYMFDQAKLYKSHLFSWRWFLIKLIPSVSIILLGYYLQLTLKWNLFNKQNTVMIIITLLLLYILWLEFYQFFHIVNFYSNIVWSFDYDEYIWSLELDSRRTRLANNYVSVCLLVKFWHFVFIFIFWVFFVLRVNESGRLRYPLLSVNIQNFIIIYMMSWAYMYPWFRFIFRKYMDTPYFWFNTDNRDFYIRVFFIDLKLFFYGIIERFFNSNISYERFDKYPFYYWIVSSPLTSYDQYKKSIIRDSIINQFNTYYI